MWELLLKSITSVIGGTTKEGESQLLELFKGSKQKLKDFELKLNEQYHNRLEMELRDRASARGMQIEALKQNDLFAKRFIYFLTGAILGVTALLSLFPLFFEIPIDNQAAITRATDFWYIIAGGSVIGFFYGTDTNKHSKNAE